MLELMPQVVILDAVGASETGPSLSSLSMGDRIGEESIFNLDPGSAVLDVMLRRIEESGHQ